MAKEIRNFVRNNTHISFTIYLQIYIYKHLIFEQLKLIGKKPILLLR